MVDFPTGISNLTGVDFLVGVEAGVVDFCKLAMVFF